MSRARAATPSATTIRVVSLLSLAWAVLALAAQTVYSVAIVPAIGATMPFSIPGRGPTVAIVVDTTAMSVVGLIVTVLGLLAAAGSVLLARGRGRGAYVVAVLVSVLVPGFVALVVGNGVGALVSSGDPSVGESLLVGFAAIAVIALAALSMLVVPKAVANRRGETYAE